MRIIWHSTLIGKLKAWWQAVKDLDKPIEPLRAHTLDRLACERCGKIVGHYPSGKAHGRHKCIGFASAPIV